MNLFIFTRDLRFDDNTTMIHQNINEGEITLIYICPKYLFRENRNESYNKNQKKIILNQLYKMNK